jgi:nitroreductase
LNPYARALLDFSIALGSYCQSLLWFANAFGLSSLCTPAIKDSGMSKLLRLPDHVLPHYTITLGYPTGTVVPRFDLKLEGKST